MIRQRPDNVKEKAAVAETQSNIAKQITRVDFVETKKELTWLKGWGQNQPGRSGYNLEYTEMTRSGQV